MTAWDAPAIAGVVLMALGLVGIVVTTQKCPDVNRDADAILKTPEGGTFTVNREGRVGYFIRLTERAYRAINEDKAIITIGPPVVMEIKP